MSGWIDIGSAQRFANFYTLISALLCSWAR